MVASTQISWHGAAARLYPERREFAAQVLIGEQVAYLVHVDEEGGQLLHIFTPNQLEGKFQVASCIRDSLSRGMKEEFVHLLVDSEHFRFVRKVTVRHRHQYDIRRDAEQTAALAQHGAYAVKEGHRVGLVDLQRLEELYLRDTSA